MHTLGGYLRSEGGRGTAGGVDGVRWGGLRGWQWRIGQGGFLSIGFLEGAEARLEFEHSGHTCVEPATHAVDGFEFGCGVATAG